MQCGSNPKVVEFGGDTTLGALLEAMDGQTAKTLIFAHDGYEVRAGYHVTEVKAGEFVTLDCGGNADHWRETILQVEDLPAEAGETVMSVGKFRSILNKVNERLGLDPHARLTLEASGPESPMQIFDPTALTVENDRVVVTLTGRPAICKPRHRTMNVRASNCCASSELKPKNACCA